MEDFSQYGRNAHDGHSSPRCIVAYGASLWFTGLPGSGKTTMANAMAERLASSGVPAVVLDGDVMRPILASELGRSEKDRFVSMSRYVDLCLQILKAPVLVIVAIINPLETHRNYARSRFPEGRYIETWVDTPLSVCMSRDPKGLYKKAMRGEICDMVGVSIPYEIPKRPDIVVGTSEKSPAESAETVFHELVRMGVLVPVRDSENHISLAPSRA